MNKQKLIIVGILILIAVMGVVAYTIFKPAQRQVSREGVQEQVYTTPEHGFSVTIPEGWSYKTTPERVGNATLVIQLTSPDKKIGIPIFIEEKAWDLVKSDVGRNFKPEAVEEAILAGQPAIKIIAKEKEINPGYNFRIKHPKKKDTVLLGTAVFIGGEDLVTFHSSVETILNSIEFN